MCAVYSNLLPGQTYNPSALAYAMQEQRRISSYHSSAPVPIRKTIILEVPEIDKQARRQKSHETALEKAGIKGNYGFPIPTARGILLGSRLASPQPLFHLHNTPWALLYPNREEQIEKFGKESFIASILPLINSRIDAAMVEYQKREKKLHKKLLKATGEYYFHKLLGNEPFSWIKEPSNEDKDHVGQPLAEEIKSINKWFYENKYPIKIFVRSVVEDKTKSKVTLPKLLSAEISSDNMTKLILDLTTRNPAYQICKRVLCIAYADGEMPESELFDDFIYEGHSKEDYFTYHPNEAAFLG